MIDADAEDAVVSSAFNAGLPQPGPHRVLRRSIEAAEALSGDEAGVVRLLGAEIPAPRFGPQPPTRESTGTIAAMPFYAGQSAGAVRAVSPAAEIVAELTAGVRARRSRGRRRGYLPSASSSSPGALLALGRRIVGRRGRRPAR